MKFLIPRIAVLIRCVVAVIFVNAALPAHSQSSGYHWRITYSYNGTNHYQLDTELGDHYEFDYDWSLEDESYNKVDLDCNDAFTATAFGTITAHLRWVDASGNDAPNPPQTVYLIESAGSSYSLQTGSDASSSANGSASNGLGDPFRVVESGPYGWFGVSEGKHFVQLDGSSGAISRTVTLQASCAGNVTCPSGLALAGRASVNFGYRLTCVVGKLDPFPPPALYDFDPVTLYHGTSEFFADKFVNDREVLEARGVGDFGRGLYTVDRDGFDLAKVIAYRAIRRSLENWAVVKFDVPLPDMLDFFCQYQDVILGYTDPSPVATPPWNAPNGLNWFNFCMLNWNEHWAGNDIDWYYAMIWGPFYDPSQPGEWDGAEALNQYLWGSGGGLSLLNSVTVARSKVAVGTGDEIPLLKLMIDPDVVVGGNSTTGRVVLCQPNPGRNGNAEVALHSSHPNIATVPYSVSIPEGEDTGFFPIVCYPVTEPDGAIISASSGGVTKYYRITVTP